MQLEAKIENLLTSPFGHFSCEAKNIFFRDMLLSHVSLVSDPTSDALQTFSLLVDGDWKEELNFHTEGLWKKEGPFWKVHVDLAEGEFLSESFALKNPFSIERNEQEFSIEPCFWHVGEGDLAAEFSLSKDHILYKGEGNHLPLGILGVLYPKMAFQGTGSFQSALSGPSSDLKGHFYLSLERADFSQNKAKGSLQIHLSSLGIQIHSHLYATNNQFLDWTATLPLNYSLSPFSWTIDKVRPITSELTMQGAVEEIFDFVNTASHKASGWITAHLFLSGTLKEPALLGSLKCEQGSYENYFTGTRLKTIEAEARASSHTLELTSLKASDEKDGSLTAQGSLFLSPKEGFPFDVKATLSQMHAVHSDLIDASLSGFLHIAGDIKSSLASGSLSVDHSLFKIFDNLPYEVPTLPVTYINKPIHLKTDFLEPFAPYPLYLDVQLTAENTVFVQGRGLDSNWYGDVKLTGTVANPAAKGSLTLKEGVFVFSGKTFTLMQGEISFHDKPTPGAYLKINGELALPSATVLAQMQGPLTSAQLTFQAIPSLPTSSILSLILFNKDISEISPLQALQLAQTIVSLSGNGGPGVLDSIRKKIGVDRLTIVGKGDTDEISVQIGWYLSHGITLSLSQSATSSDVTVEVDLKKGFIFQAETQNQEEGKFSFKWNKNY
jgi:translocation and assembly module TamB